MLLIAMMNLYRRFLHSANDFKAGIDQIF